MLTALGAVEKYPLSICTFFSRRLGYVPHQFTYFIVYCVLQIASSQHMRTMQQNLHQTILPFYTICKIKEPHYMQVMLLFYSGRKQSHTKRYFSNIDANHDQHNFLFSLHS